jgi:dihydrofolate synthase/folylpolyglutamate synthase
VVIGESNAETDFIFIETSRKYFSSIVFANQRWKIVPTDQVENNSLLDVFCDNELRFQNLDFPLKGSFQYKNLCTVLEATQELIKQKLRLTPETITKGIGRVIENTGLHGRWQIIGKNPLVICDSGHNEPAVREIVFNLSKIKFENLRIVFGMVNDKNHSTVLNLLPKTAEYYFCKANIPRGLHANILAEKAFAAGLCGNIFGSVEEAYKSAISQSDQNDLVFVGGSIFVVAEILQNIEF